MFKFEQVGKCSGTGTHSLRSARAFPPHYSHNQAKPQTLLKSHSASGSFVSALTIDFLSLASLFNFKHTTHLPPCQPPATPLLAVVRHVSAVNISTASHWKASKSSPMNRNDLSARHWQVVNPYPLKCGLPTMDSRNR
jgi:hypothetical protein